MYAFHDHCPSTGIACFWRDAAVAHGIVLPVGIDADLGRLDDQCILDIWFADLSDPERVELLWARGGVES